MGTLPDRRMIALASVGEGLDEDVQVEIAARSRVGVRRGNCHGAGVPGIPLPHSAYDRARRRYQSTRILRQLVSEKPPHAARLIGVADVDLYVPELDFVFEGRWETWRRHRLACSCA
jgi:predicted Zn-dependent protease